MKIKSATMPKRANPRHIRAALNYTIEEAAIALGVSIPTVRSWGTQGLLMLRCQRPYLIVGEELKRFLEAKANNRKCPLGRNEFYCLSCRQATKPLGMMADFVPDTTKTGRLICLCGKCERTCHRMTSKVKIPLIAPNLDIAIRDVGNT